MQGCTQSQAVNYQAAATIDDRSCIYLFHKNGACHMFEDVPEEKLVDRSFTVSWSLVRKAWVFFHDYLPESYMHTREQLWAHYAQELYKLNAGPYGVFMNGTGSFYLDIAFSTGEDSLLESVNWITEVLGSNGVTEDQMTFTHISIRTSKHHTGRIALANTKYRKTKGEWSFKDFRDKVIGVPFIEDLFKSYAVIDSALGERPWYEEMRLKDKYFIVRFEFDTTQAKQIIVHNLGVQVIKTDR